MSCDQVSAKADVLPETAYPPQGLSPSPTLATRSSLGAHFSMADRGRMALPVWKRDYSPKGLQGLVIHISEDWERLPESGTWWKVAQGEDVGMWDSSVAGSRQNVLSWRASFLSCCDDSQKLGGSGGLYIKRNLFSLQKTEYKENFF